MQQTQRRRNPCDRNGFQLRCLNYEKAFSIWQRIAQKLETLYTQEVVLYQSDFDHKILVSELWNSAVLDSGTISAVAGEVCYNCYITSLN